MAARKGFYGNIIHEMKAIAHNPGTRQFLLAYDPKALEALDKRIAKMEKADAAILDWSASAVFRLPAK